MNTPEEKITYSVICENSPTPDVYFDTYEEAVNFAKFEQPAYRPYYIVERVEHFEICGVVDKATEFELTEQMKNDRKNCGEDSRCLECACHIGEDDCVFNHLKAESEE